MCNARPSSHEVVDIKNHRSTYPFALAPILYALKSFQLFVRMPTKTTEHCDFTKVVYHRRPANRDASTSIQGGATSPVPRNSGGGKRLIKSERGHNRSAHSHLVGASSRLHKLDEASTATKHVKVSLKFSKAMMRERLARKWTQKQLAQQINEKPQVVHQYESGQAIPNATITQKLNKALGGTLPAARDVRIHRVKTPGG